MKWIKCSEQLPLEYEYVLICGMKHCGFSLISIGMYKDSGWEFMDENNTAVFSDYMAYGCNIEDITHWAELPEMPQCGTKCHDLDETDIDALPK